MAKFTDLNESDKIQAVKDKFAELIGFVSSEPEKLKDYIAVGDKPKPIVAITDPLTDKMSPAQRADVEEKNRIAEEKAKAENVRIDAEYADKATLMKKAQDVISKLAKKEGCICNTCFNVDVANGIIPPELEPLIEAARKQAESEDY
jgi:hypothetical protein